MYLSFELIIAAFDRKEKYQLLITTNKAQARLPFTDNLSQEIVRRHTSCLDKSTAFELQKRNFFYWFRFIL